MNQIEDGFFSPVEMLARHFAPGAKKSGFTKEEKEERQAALFGYAYAVGRALESLVIKPGEGPQHDYDAQFRWQDEKSVCTVPVQLKQLPSEKISASETLENIIQKASVKCTGNDLLVAINLDRRGHIVTTTVPKAFRIREICFWGWSKPDHAELFVNRYVVGASEGHQWFVPFPPPGFRRV